MAQTKIPKQVSLDATRGMLNMQLYVYFTKPTNGLEAVLANLDEHLKFQVDLERRGILFGAGPFWTEDEQFCELEGMIIIRAESLAAARAMTGSVVKQTFCSQTILPSGPIAARLSATCAGVML